MATYAASKRINMVGSVVHTLCDMIKNNTMAQNFGLTDAQVDAMGTAAIHETAQLYKVTDSTVYSKCVRELGFSSKVDFVQSLIKQMARVEDRLYYALIHHMTNQDNVWDIERMLGLPFNYA